MTKIEVESLSPVERRVTVEVPWTVVKEELDLAYKGLQRRAKVKGFRPGHVPRKVLEQYYRSTVEGEVVQRLMDDGFRQAVREKDLFPISSPIVDANIQFAHDAPFRFSAKVEVKPEVTVTGYKGLELVRQVREVEESAVSRELEMLRERATLIEQVKDRNTTQKGDIAVVDFFGYVNGETFKGGKGINYSVELGSGRMIAGFEDQLVGMKIGERREFRLVFPQNDGPEEVRGKNVDWQVDLKEIKTKILPELDDEFAKDLGEYNSLVELKEKIKENLKTREIAKSRRLLRERALEKLVEMNAVDVPPAMIERQLDFLLEEVMKAAKDGNPTMREVVTRLRNDNKERAKKQVAAMLLIEGVGRAENVTVSEADVDARINDIARQNRMSARAVRQQLEREGRLEALRYDMRQDKTIDLVLDSATITDEIVTGPPPESGLGLAPEAASEAEHDHDHDHDH